jgi:hypothetical protein
MPGSILPEGRIGVVTDSGEGDVGVEILGGQVVRGHHVLPAVLLVEE